MSTYIKPHFLVIGAQRSGTTWIHKQLSKHSCISMPPIKELHYFDYMDRHHYHFHESRRYTQHLKSAAKRILLFQTDWRSATFYLKYFIGPRDDDWYVSLFDHLQQPGQIAGEVTPAYANLSYEMWMHIKTKFPNIKLIYILRDPVQRVWSNLVRKEVRNKGRDISTLTDEKISTALENPRYYINSTYSKTIKTIDSVFDSNNILYLFYDELKESPNKMYQRLCKFLEMEQDENTIDETRSNAAASNFTTEIPEEVVKIVVERMHSEYRCLSSRFPGCYPDRWIRRYPMLAKYLN